MVGSTGRHGRSRGLTVGRLGQGLVRAAEVVVEHGQVDRTGLVPHLRGDCIGPARVPAHAHP